jgi:hypothetical protein
MMKLLNDFKNFVYGIRDYIHEFKLFKQGKVK